MYHKVYGHVSVTMTSVILVKDTCDISTDIIFRYKNMIHSRYYPDINNDALTTAHTHDTHSIHIDTHSIHNLSRRGLIHIRYGQIQIVQIALISSDIE